jgi:hypothetical protein
MPSTTPTARLFAAEAERVRAVLGDMPISAIDLRNGVEERLNLSPGGPADTRHLGH